MEGEEGVERGLVSEIVFAFSHHIKILHRKGKLTTITVKTVT
jgi:hypothetical protein